MPSSARWSQLGPSVINGGYTFGGVTFTQVSGRITQIVVHPKDADLIFAATARGGIWRSRTAGASWQPVSDGAASLAIGALALAPSDPSVLYAGTGEGNLHYVTLQLEAHGIAAWLPECYCGVGILKTIDGGDTWIHLGASDLGRSAFYRLAIAPRNSNVVLSATSAGLHRTRDGGHTWQAMMLGLPPISSAVSAASDVLFDTHDPATAYAAFSSRGIFRTRNIGAPEPQWQPLPLPAIANFSRITLAADASSTWVYAAFAGRHAEFPVKAVYRFDPLSDTWEQVFVLPPIPPGPDYSLFAYASALAVDPVRSDSIYVGGENLSNFRRRAGSADWQRTNIGDSIHADQHAIAFDPNNGSRLYVGNDGGVFRSEDSGKSFTSLNDGLCIAEIQGLAQSAEDENILLLGTHDNGAQLLRHSSKAQVIFQGDVGSVLIDPHAAATFTLAVQGEVWQSATGGKTWRPSDLTSGGLATRYPPMGFSPTCKTAAYGASPYVYFNLKAGADDWFAVRCTPSPESIVSLKFVSDDVLFVGTASGGVYRIARSSSAGWGAGKTVALHCAPLPAGHWVRAFDSASPVGDNVTVVLTGFGNPHVWRADVDSDGSAVWQSLDGRAPNSFPDLPANSLIIDPADHQRIFVGSDAGVFETRDGGATWSCFSDGLPKTRVNVLLLNPKTRRMRAGTDGRGVWECIVPVTCDSRWKADSEALPTAAQRTRL